MKDVIFIIVDSLCYDYVGKKYNAQSATPFLDTLKANSVFADRCYSQGPYTEAGTKGLLCGTDVLDDKGYLYRFDKSKYFITDLFKENGYETYGILYPTCVLSQKTLDHIDHLYYTSGFMFDVLWSQKLMYYVDLFEKNGLSDAEYEDVADLLELIFEAWLGFLRCGDHPEEYVLLSDVMSDYPWQTYRETVEGEKVKFQINNREYIDNMFLQKEKHILNKIPCIDFSKMIRSDAIDAAFEENKAFIGKLKKKQRRLNRRNAKIPPRTYKNVMKRIRTKGLNKYTFGEYLYKLQLVNRGKDIHTTRTGSNYKLLLSAHTQFRQVAGIMKTNTEKPKFIISHVEEPHYFTTYFSYDSSDKSLISDELKYAEAFVDSVSEDFRGLLSYQLAVRYVDREIENLFSSLRSMGKLDNTMVVIVADHGSSYNCEPLRERMVNNFHAENYHIPLWIYCKDIVKRVDKWCSGKDVIPTMLDCLNLPKPDALTGSSILSGTGEYSFVEYMGPGCPDMRRRPVWLAIRNSRYLICYIGKLRDGFNDRNITEIYDLEKDPHELINISNTRNPEIETMINALRARFDMIYENNKNWISG